MDAAYNQHSPYSRHHVRSHSSLNHLTLAPLTSRLPLSDADALPDTHHMSYIEGRSAPTTPSILSRSSSRVSVRKPMNISLPKSKSSIHLTPQRQPRSGATTPNSATRSRKGRIYDDLSLSAAHRNDSDWLLRAGAAISFSTRESKGQTWLVSRASSTSLSGQRDEDDEDLERELAREREVASRRASRRGSTAPGAFDADDEFSPVTTRRSLSFGPTAGTGSRPASRFGSRANSRTGSRPHMFTPIEADREGYFDQHFAGEFIAEPDFVDVEDDGFEHEGEDDAKKDDAVVRRLARASSGGVGGWVERMLGWSLFAVDEDGEEPDLESVDEKGESSDFSSRISRRAFDGSTDSAAGEVPPPQAEDAGGWQDAAWLLSVATKVLL